jgi:predicted nucleic acid-binding protein
MSRLVMLDAGPLGLITNPKATFEVHSCSRWLQALLSQGIEVAIPEIADYEIRRELLRADKLNGLARLDSFKARLGYVAITTDAMLLAAQLWARARKAGRPTASDTALDADVILAAQALLMTQSGYDVEIATTNVKHIEQFATAKLWQDIT